jgi:hypothetical protein
MREKGPVHNQMDSSPIDFVEIGKQFNATKHGEALKRNIRFATFKPETTSNSEWQSLLGSDVNNLHHLKLSFELTKRFLDHCSNPDSSWQGRIPKEATFSPQEQSLLQLTAIVHDWGEAVIGDIPLPNKTKADEEKEMVALRGLIHEVLGENNKKEFCDTIADGVRDVLSDPSTKLGKAFNAIEYVGYTRTALRAWDRSQKVEGSMKSNLQQMASEVVPYGLSRLVAYSEIYPPVDLFLKHHKNNIDQILEEQGKLPYIVRNKVIWQADSKI